MPGNIASTLATIDALDGLPIHLTHIQFHSYGTEGPRKFSSAARAIAEAVNAQPNVSIDVGQIMFGQTVTASGDTMMQFKQRADFAIPRKWIVGRYRMRCGLRHRAVPLSRAKLRERAAMDIGLETFPAGRRPVARSR